MEIIEKIKSVIFYIALFILSCMFSLQKSWADLDLWHRMAVGKIYSQLGHVVYHDIFTYFPSKPLWVDHEWLSGVIFYNLGRYFGDYGLMILKIIIIFSILVLIYKTNRLISSEFKTQRIFWYFLALLAIIPGLAATLRCQAFTYLFFTLWIYVLEKIRRNNENRLIWIFPATTLLWINMHAGFIAGFGLIGFYAIGELLNKRNILKYIGILALCLPFTFINPYGIKYWHYLIEAITMPRPYITEWGYLNPFESFYKVIGTKIQLMFLLPAFIYSMLAKIANKTIIRSDQQESLSDPYATASPSLRMTEKIQFDWVEIIAFIVTLVLSIKHYRHVCFSR